MQKKKKKSRRDLKDTSVHVKLILVEKKGYSSFSSPTNECRQRDGMASAKMHVCILQVSLLPGKKKQTILTS